MLQSPPINTPLNFLISSHHLTISLSSSLSPPMNLLPFLLFFLLYFGVNRERMISSGNAGEKISSEQLSWGKELDWVKLNV